MSERELERILAEETDEKKVEQAKKKVFERRTE